MIYSQLGQTKEAAGVLTHYLTLEPENNDARVHLAVLLFDTGETEQGIHQLEWVMAREPEHADALRVVGELQSLLDSAPDEA